MMALIPRIANITFLLAAASAALAQEADGPRVDPFGDPLPAGAIARMGTIRGEEAADQPGIYLLAISPDGQLLATRDADHAVRLWDVATGKESRRLGKAGESSDWIKDIAFSPDGKWLATAVQDGPVEFYSVETGDKEKTLSPGGKRICFLDDRRTLAVVSEQSLTTFDFTSGRTIKSLSDMPPIPHAISGDGRLLAATRRFGDEVIGIYETDGGAQKGFLSPVPAFPVSVALNGDGTKAAASFRGRDEGSVLLWAGEKTGPTAVLVGHTDQVQMLAFSPSGRLLATGSFDNTVRIWETETGGEIAVLEGHTQHVVSVAFSPDERLLASGASGNLDGAADNTALVWRLSEVLFPPQDEPPVFDPPTLAGLWDDLAGDDARAAWAAIGILAFSPEKAASLFEEKLAGIVKPVTAEEIKRLIVELDADDFNVREKATERLVSLRPGCDDELKAAAEDTSSAEVQFRIRRILSSDIPNERPKPEERRRLIRLIATLEAIGDGRSRKLMEAIANGHPAPEIAAHAAGSLGRMGSADD